MFDQIKSLLIGCRCFKPPENGISSPPSPPIPVRRGPSEDPVSPKAKTDLTTKPPPVTPERPHTPTPIPTAPSQDEDESFKIPGPPTWEIPRDSPVVVQTAEEDMGRYMTRCIDCLERKGEVILRCGHGVCQKCFERCRRNERCIGCRAILAVYS